VSLLDDIIDGATDDGRSTSNLLRMVQTAATRVQAERIVEWAKRELNGYPADVPLPTNREERATRVMGTFFGYGGSSIRHELQRPVDDEWDLWFETPFRQPLAELEAFAAEDEDATIGWPPFVIMKYEREGHFGYQGYSLQDAQMVLPRQMLRGLIDSVRNTALEFALELQGANVDAGTVGGPTIASDEALAGTVYQVTNNIYGPGANISAGNGVTQSSTVIEGDTAGLLAAVQALGLSHEAATEFGAAVDDDRSVDGPRVRAFLDRVRAGTVEVATGLATKVATAELANLALHYLGTLH
jgi:hypothetical protein